MKKVFSSLIVLMLSVFASGTAFAQTDITSILGNQLADWQRDDLISAWTNGGAVSANPGKEAGAEFTGDSWEIWTGSASSVAAGRPMYKSIDLPAGSYVIKAAIQTANQGGGVNEDAEAYFYAGEAKVKCASQVLKYRTIEFTLDKATPLEYGIKFEEAGIANWSAIGDITLTTTSYASVAEIEAAIVAAKEELEAAQQELENQRLIAIGQAAIASGVIPTNTLENWVASTLGDGEKLQVNTWSGEGATDGSGMLTPFIENWHNRGTNLVDKTITYPMKGLEEGWYEIGGLFRCLNELGGITPVGIYMTMNADEYDMTEGASACNNGTFKKLTKAVQVGADGSLVIGVKVSGANVNWINWRDFTIKKMAPVTQADIDAEWAKMGKCEKALYDAAEAAKATVEASLSPADFAAYKEAVAAAGVSAEAYANVKATLDRAEALDEAGQAKFAELTAEIVAAYEAGTIVTAECAATITEICGMLVVAAKAQTTPGADMTLAIANNSFETGALAPWTAASGGDTGVKPNSNGTYTAEGCDGAYLFNTWGASDMHVAQVLTDMPAGGYELKALYASDAGNKATLSAANVSVEIAASEAGKGKFVEATLSNIILTEAGELTINMASDSWFKADNFRLTYTGSANAALAAVDYAWWEGLCGELTAAMAGNEEYITADTRMAIKEFMKEDNYPNAIQAALEDAIEAGTVYACPFDKALIEAQVRGWIAEIEAVKNGEIALYTEGGIVGDATLNSNMPFYATPVGVEVYANQTVVIKGWDGVEGSDLKIAYTLRNTLEEGEDVEPQLVITGIEQTVNGEVVSEFVEDEENPELSYVSLVPAEGSDYAGVMVYPFNEMTTVLVGKEEETGMGQVSLYGVWAKMPVATEPAEGEDAEVDPGFGQSELETVEAAYIVTWPGQPIINGIVWNNIKTQIAQVEDAIANYDAVVAEMKYASQYEGEEVTAGVDAARAWVEATKAEYAAKAEAEELTFEDGVMGEMMEQLMNVSESLNYAAMYDVNRYGAAVTNLWIGDDDEFEGVRDALVAQIEALEVAGKSALEEKVNNIDQAWSAIAEAIATYTAYNEDTHAEIVALCEQTIAEIQALVAEVEEIANYLYTAEGKVGDGSDIDNSPFAGSEVEVEVNKNFVLVRGWDGTPGSDLKVYYTSLTTLEESENIEPQLVITGIEQIVDGEVVSELDEIGDDETVVRLYPQSDVYPMATIYVANEMTGIKLEENAGQIALMGDWQPASNLGGEDDNMGVAEPVEAVYMVTWPIYVEPVQPITEPREWQFTNDDDATAALASSVADEYGYWASSSKGRYSYAKTIEKEELMLTPEAKLPITEGLFFTMTKANDILVGTPAGNNGRLQLGGSAPVVYIPNCGAGDVVTITALWATKNASTITIDNGSCVLEEDAVTSFDLTGSTTEYKITVTEDGDLALHSKAVVYTAIKVTPDPSTGISNAAATVNVTTDAIYNLAGQKVDAQYKGIVIVNGKKFLKK